LGIKPPSGLAPTRPAGEAYRPPSWNKGEDMGVGEEREEGKE